MNVPTKKPILSDDVLSRFDVATADGSGLPNECYTSDEWLAAENTKVFARSWMLAGFLPRRAREGRCQPDLAGRHAAGYPARQ